MGEIECADKCGNLTDREGETLCDTCIQFSIAHVQVLSCNRCLSRFPANNTRHYCAVEDKTKKRGKFGFYPQTGLWVD